MENDRITKMLAGSTPLKAIISGMGYAISIQDADLKVAYQNDAHKNLFGSHIGDFCYKGFLGRNSICEECPVVTSLQDGAVHSAIYKRITEKGVLYTELTASPVTDADGKITGGVEVARDITYRIRADEVSRETMQMLEDITQGITESILLLSTDYTVLWANKAALEQTGLAKNELLGNYCYAATHDRDCHCEPPNEPCPVRDLLETGKPKAAEHEHHDKNGKKVYAEVSAYPIKDDFGKIVRFVHISKNISERKNLEQEREKLILDLQEALAEIRTLKGIIPICSSCKKIRNDSGYWEQMEEYIRKNSDAEFTHGICPSCARKLYSGILEDQV